MTGLVRKAMLLGVCGLFFAASAFAFVPDPATSTVPNNIFVVSTINANAPDVDGADGSPFLNFGGTFAPNNNTNNVIIIKDFAGNPISGVAVHIKFPCDIKLCTLSAGPPYTTTYSQTVSCDADGSRLHGVTDAAGRFEFAALGAAKDVAGAPLIAGGAFGSTIVTVDGFVGTFKSISTGVLNQNGAVAAGGVSGTDVVCVISQAGLNNQVARADLNASSNVSGLDASFELGHAGRLSNDTTTGCEGANLCAVTCTP